MRRVHRSSSLSEMNGTESMGAGRGIMTMSSGIEIGWDSSCDDKCLSFSTESYAFTVVLGSVRYESSGVCLVSARVIFVMEGDFQSVWRLIECRFVYLNMKFRREERRD